MRHPQDPPTPRRCYPEPVCAPPSNRGTFEEAENVEVLADFVDGGTGGGVDADLRTNPLDEEPQSHEGGDMQIATNITAGALRGP